MFSLLYYQLIRSLKRHERTIHGRKNNSPSNEMKKYQATNNDKQVEKKRKKLWIIQFQVFQNNEFEKQIGTQKSKSCRVYLL